MSNERIPTPVIYVALMPVALILSILVEFAAIMAANALPDWVPGRWMGIPLFADLQAGRDAVYEPAE